MDKKYFEFVYKTKHYQFDLRSAIHTSDYFWKNLDSIINQNHINLVDNDEDWNFSDESIQDFISYLQNPNYDTISNTNVYTFKKLDEKYQIHGLKDQLNKYVQQHKKELIIFIINEKNSLEDQDIKCVFDRLFEFIDNKYLQLLSIEFIDRILQYYRSQVPDDSIENETKIMNFFIEYFGRNGKPASILFKHVNFLKVGSECLLQIKEKYSDTFDYDQVPSNVVRKLCDFYADHSASKTRTQTASKEMEFLPSNGKELEGILKFLTNKTNGNIHENGTIEITAKSIYNDTYHQKNLVDYQNQDSYYFKDKKIQLTDYTIKTFYGYSDWAHLKNWSIEVSNDQSNWIEVDRHENAKINKKSFTAKFHCKKQIKEFYRFIRLKQTGESWYNSDHNTIAFSKIEFFGKLLIK